MRKTTKILVSALLTLCMLLPMAMPVFATTASHYDGSEIGLAAITTAKEAFIAGTKTTIESANDLVAFSQASAAGTTFSGVTITLTTDVVLNEGNAFVWQTTAPAVVWTPIKDFQGTFNGNGKTVSGLYVNTSEAVCVGLFGCLKDGAKVLDLGVVNSYMINTNTSTASDTATPYMGSIAGMISGKNVQIIGCYSDAFLSSGYTGGIVGNVEKTEESPDLTTPANIGLTTASLVSQCVFAGRAQALTGSAAGIVATTDPVKTDSRVYDAVIIKDCVNFGEISVKYNQSGLTAGGIIGLIEQYDGIAIVERCLNFGKITAGSQKGSATQTNTKSNALIGQVRNTADTYITISHSYIFTNIGQSYLFSNQSVGSCNNCTYTINGNTNSASNTISTILSAETSNYTISDVCTIKGAAAANVLTAYDFAGTDANKADWVTCTDSCPIPKIIDDNFSDDISNVINKWTVKFNYLEQIKDSEPEYAIGSSVDAVAIAELLNVGAFASNGSGLKFKLTNDIIFNEGNVDNWWKNESPAYQWVPIDNFKGNFDGQGYYISGVYLSNISNFYTNKANDTYLGLFINLLQNSTLSNIGVVNSYYKANTTYMATIAARINATGVTVTGCYSDATLYNTKSQVGGIIALVSGTGGSSTDTEQYATISKCVFEGTLTSATGNAGGIVAQGAQYQYNHVKVVDSANFGTVTAATNAGAIVGIGATITVENCMNFGTVTSEGEETTYADGALAGAVGSTNSAAVAQLNVDNCYNMTSTVISSGTTTETTKLVTNDIKTELPTGFTNWTTRTNYASEDKYPLPTVIYENFFKVKLAYYQTTNLYEGNKYDLRIIAEIDSLDYAKAGFKVTRDYDGKTLDVDTTEGVKVYKTVTGGGEDVTAIGDKYFVTITIEGISGAQTITVTPYTNGTANGELVEGAAMELSFDANGNLINN